ncbi:MAG: O-antigen ligase family protein [Planctomycetota bacterium]
MPRGWAPLLAMAALALPFHPYWPDYEHARRGLALVLGGGLALAAHTWWPRRPGLPLLAMIGLAAWSGVRSLGVAQPHAGWSGAAYWLALAVMFGFGSGHAGTAWRTAMTLTGAAVSTFGLLQAIRLVPELGAPTSTLGNLNVAAELVAVATAGAAAAAVATDDPAQPRRRLAWLALLLGAAYLGSNGSRSGMLALPVALALVAMHRGTTWRARLMLLVVAVGGLAAGNALTGPPPEAPREATAGTATNDLTGTTAPSTVEVRLELWRGTGAMALEHPWFGVGAGQFAVHYPRYRSQREIELSSFGRQFHTAPKTPHNDHLEVLAELGLAGLGLWIGLGAIVLVTVWRRHGPAAAAPLAAFAVLTLVRSPTGNAPAAALAAGYAGSLLGRQAGAPASLWLRGLWAAAGASLIWLGVPHVSGQCAAAGSFPPAKVGSERADQALSRALAWDPANAQLREMRLRRRLRRGATAEDMRDDAAALASLRPFEPNTLRLRAEIELRSGRDLAALRLLSEVLRLDPGDLEAHTMSATIFMRQGKVAEAIATLLRDPHPRQRASLAANFAAFASAAAQRATQSRDAGDPNGAADWGRAADAYRVEELFVRGVDLLSTDDAAAVVIADQGRTVTRLSRQLRELQANLAVADARPLCLAAAAALLTDEPELADAAGVAAQTKQLRLTTAHSRLLGPLRPLLATSAPWRQILPEATRRE